MIKEEGKTETKFRATLENVKGIISSRLDDGKEHKTGEIIEHFAIIKNINELTTYMTLLNDFNFREFTPKILNLEKVMEIIGRGKSEEQGVLMVHFTLREGNK